ncbi:MAG TPA: T9SS type A sorting domain-containing protein [Bacteroidia bacterium]|jgi:hypothetical protein|nr:T9SS type A sorting domain-containing protein [Bacteroidia bacterium]
MNFKFLVLGILSCCAGLNQLFAQTSIYNQNFETAPTTSIPAGWSQQQAAADPNNKGWKFGTSPGGTLGNYIPAHTNYAWVDDLDNNTSSSTKSNKDSLYSSVLNFSAYSHVFISFDYWFVEGFVATPGDAEVMTIAGSTDGGVTWTTLDTIGGGLLTWESKTKDISALAGQSNVKLCFTYSDGGYAAIGEALDNINIYSPLSLDLGTVSQTLNYYIQANTPNTVKGTLYNFGYTTTNSVNVNYSVNGGPAVTTALTGLTIPALSGYSFSASTPWTPTTSGAYTLKIWVDSPNGGTDQNHLNDTLSATFMVLDSIQVKMPLVEEFNQASCDPCARATPHLDSVLSTVDSYCSAIRYHVSWPGTDYMNKATQTPFISSRVGFYSVSGVPDAKLDGADCYPATLLVTDIQKEAAKGSPFKIDVVATYSTSTKTYSAQANIKAYGPIPSGMVAQVVLTVDTITYHSNQSTESIPQTVFPQVAEEMMPGPNGTTLGAFTSGQIQTVNVQWAKNHPWGTDYAAWPYDSTKTHITVFIQNSSSKFVYQSAHVAPTVIAGIEEYSTLEGLTIYPNPSNGVATISFQLKEEAKVKMELYNALGELIRSTEKGTLPAGENNMILSGSDLSEGIYFIRLTAGAYMISRKITISK